MKINSSVPTTEGVAIPEVQTDPQEEAKLRRALEVTNIAIKVIKVVAIVLVAAAVIGIWAFPMDLVIYENMVRVAAIPASIVFLPVALAVCGFFAAVFCASRTGSTKLYHRFLLQELLNAVEPSEALKAKYCEISKKVDEFYVSPSVQAASFDRLKYAMDAIPRIERMDLGKLPLSVDVVYELIENRKSIQCIEWVGPGEPIDENRFSPLGYETYKSGDGYVIRVPRPEAASSTDDSDSDNRFGVDDSPSYSSSHHDGGGHGYSAAFEWR